jgi:UDP-N-acetylmuramoyl-tripeptide--D-alanyl-D-alanine ligase
VRFTTAELAAHLGGTVVGPDVTVEGASIDTRSSKPGQLYVPIVAERDGHDFIPAAIAAGCPAYLTSRDLAGATAVLVDDTASALMSLGELARGRISGKVVGITGSVGKTTTKDILARCLASTFSTAASERSFNNELGLPLTLLNAPESAQQVVLEMGARGVGHITRLLGVARPDVGIVTSVALAHVEYFGDLDGVARAKGELVAGLPPTGVAVLNFDDHRVARMADFSPCPVLGYAVRGDAVGDEAVNAGNSVRAGADVWAERVSLDAELRPSFRLVTPWGKAEVDLSLHGVHQVGNALAATAAALWCGVPLDAVVASLADVSASPLRMEVRHPAGGPTLLVDCYNANPASTEAALRSLAAISAARRVALLGVMAELGADTASEHLRILSVAAALGIEVVGYGTDLYGGPSVDGIDEAVALLRSTDATGAVLVKGSRVARLEDVVRAFDGQSPSPVEGPVASTSTREESSP